MRLQSIAMAALFTLLPAFLLSATSSETSRAQSAETPKTGAPAKVSRDWLLDAGNDTERFRRLQAYIRGYGQPMWEIGQRYLAVYQALDDRNFDLAEYHWSKIAIAMRNGAMVSPGRGPNTDALFLTPVFAPSLAALKSRDPAKAWQGFIQGRQACLSCHDAEKVGYMNNQPMFAKTAVPPLGLGLRQDCQPGGHREHGQRRKSRGKTSPAPCPPTIKSH
jgi:hypothetical protein